MSYSIASYIWPLFTLLIGGLQITAAALLIRDRGWSPWMMLAGGVLSTIGQLSILLIRVLFPDFFQHNTYMIYTSLSSVGVFGVTLFSLGLLVYALRRRGQANRVAELEAILATIQQS